MTSAASAIEYGASAPGDGISVTVSSLRVRVPHCLRAALNGSGSCSAGCQAQRRLGLFADFMVRLAVCARAGRGGETGGAQRLRCWHGELDSRHPRGARRVAGRRVLFTTIGAAVSAEDGAQGDHPTAEADEDIRGVDRNAGTGDPQEPRTPWSRPVQFLVRRQPSARARRRDHSARRQDRDPPPRRCRPRRSHPSAGRPPAGVSGAYTSHPSELGVPFEDVEIETTLGPAPAWLIPADSGAGHWVIQVHGRGASARSACGRCPCSTSRATSPRC